MNLYFYDDYRLFLLDYFKNQATGAKKSISISMGISPSLMSQVLSGDRHLNQDQAFQFSLIVQFNRTQKLYWLALVDFQKASSVQLQEFLKERMDEIREQRND